MNTILVVDDEKKIAQLVRDYLEDAGFRVAVAYDGKAAMAQFRYEPPDLVVLDLNLPGMGGMDIARAIRRERNTPIIMLTNLDANDFTRESQLDQIDAYLGFIQFFYL